MPIALDFMDPSMKVQPTSNYLVKLEMTSDIKMVPWPSLLFAVGMKYLPNSGAA